MGGWDARGFWMSPWEGVPGTWVQRSLCEPPYLAGGSRGNSRRLAASSSVKKTGVIWTFKGSAAPRSAEQRGQGPLWAGEDGEGGRKCFWGNASSPQAGPVSSSGPQNRSHKAAATVSAISRKSPRGPLCSQRGIWWKNTDWH